MAYSRLSVPEIQSWQPAADYRKTGSFGVIEGENFSWDAAGVRADFASRLVAGAQSIASFGEYVQSVKVGEEYHIIANSRVYRFIADAEGSPTGMWLQIATLTKVQVLNPNLIAGHLRSFTSFNMGGKAYVNSWNSGCYRVDLGTMTYTRLTSGTVPGFPDDTNPVYAVTESSGRAVYLTKEQLFWSGPAQPEDLTPTLGGAGFQTISQLMSGEPRTLLRVDRGILVWTTTGAMAGEFIGAPLVFRFYQYTVDIMPLNQSAMVFLPDGATMALTQLGVYRIKDLGIPSQVSPLFGEFFREYVRNKKLEDATLWYNQPDNRLFVAMRQAGSQFDETFCLDVNIDKWGSMNHNHAGLIQYQPARTQLGYISTDGIVSYLLPTTDERKSIENESEPGTYRGLNSYVEIGYFRIEGMLMGGEGLQEITGVMVYRGIDVQGLLDTTVDEGMILDAEIVVVDEGEITDTDFSIYDEGVLSPGNTTQGYRMQLLSDFNGYDATLNQDFSVVSAHLSKQSLNTDWWTGSMTGHYLSLRISAVAPGEYYRINTLDITMAYVGDIGG